MPPVGFENMATIFEREKTVNVLDCAAIVIGTYASSIPPSNFPLCYSWKYFTIRLYFFVFTITSEPYN
jgi:hypothetical protein